MCNNEISIIQLGAVLPTGSHLFLITTVLSLSQDFMHFLYELTLLRAVRLQICAFGEAVLCCNLPWPMSNLDRPLLEDCLEHPSSSFFVAKSALFK